MSVVRSALVDRPQVNARPAGRRRWSAGGMLIALDVIAIVAAIAIERTLPSSFGHLPLAWSAGYACAVMAGLFSRGLYGWRQRRGGLDLIATIVAVTAVAAMATLSLRTAFGAEPDVASRVVRLWLFTATYLTSAHIGGVLALRRLRAGEVIGSPTLIVGAGDVGQTIARRLQAMPSLGLMPIGFADDEPIAGDGALALPRLGGFDDLTAILEAHAVDCVIVAFPNRRDHEIAGSVRALARRGVEVLIVPRLFEDLTTRVHVERLGGYALLSQRHARPGGAAIACKYAIERVAAAAALVVLSPLLLAIALAVRRSGPGTVLFRQPRVGLDGHEFELLKFRTMHGDPAVDGHADTHWLAATLGTEGGAPGLDRSTPVGIRLRRWSLDELPQLLNIVRGDMALIGPRPERVAYARLLSERIYRYGDRHRVRSGLTGWAQIKDLRGESSLPDRVAWDNDYIENWSFWLDLKILLLTVPAVVRHARAKR
jgi:exopolysaccharide biosynthesis polyprenyl glycosylphosphotransferase